MSTSAIPPIGSHVVLVRKELIDGKRTAVEYAAIVFGYERANDHDVEVDGQPNLTIVYADPSKITQFGGADFTEAFDRLFSVPHEDVNAQGHIFWKYAGEVESAGLPSSADLDEDAKEKLAREATSPKVRQIKGSKA